jgi:outer membrane receptor protein involved in Fe transport
MLRGPLRAGVATLALALGTFTASAPALAQAVTPPATDPSASQDAASDHAEARPSLPQQSADSGQSDGESLHDVIVTGTHIARPELQSAMPISVISAEDAQNYGRDTIYDSLLLNPAIGPGLGEMNSGGQEYDQGVANINLRNLGANRSLVLVDGQRWVSGGARTSAVDLNTIPSALIDHYEVVTGGASAVYGADAIAGAVNIIMKKEVKGLHLSFTDGISDQGDAAQRHGQISFGKEFAGGRGHILFGADYTSTDPISDAERGLTNHRYVYEPNSANNLAPGIPKSTGPNDGIPDNVLVDYKQFYRSSVPTFCVYAGKSPCGSNAGQWYQLINGQLTSIPKSSYMVYGSPSDVGVETDNGTGGLPDTVDGLYTNVLMRIKSVKASGMLRANYELTPSITWNNFFSFAHSYTRGNTEWPVVRDDERATNWYGGGPGEVAKLTDPYLPASLRAFMVANNITSIPLDRTYANLPTPWEIHNRDNISFGTDVGGALIGQLTWGAFGRFGQVIDHIETENALGGNEWLQARNAIVDPVTGVIECADPAARAAGCAPFNYYTTDAPSQAFDNYALKNRFERTMNSMLNTGVHTEGSVLHLPYGDLAIAAGVEWRQETLHTTDDPDTAKVADILLGGADYSAHPEMYARRRTLEAYGEVNVPLLKDLPFAKRLSIEGAYRFSHYNDNPDTGTWKAGGSWEPISGVTFRGTYSYAVRVPNFGELLSPATVTSGAAIADPCSTSYIKSNPNYASTCAGVLASRGGLALPYPNTNRPNLLAGGNPDLTPETARTYTIGAVFEPKFLHNFDLTVDYWKINITNVITTLSDTTILDNCYGLGTTPNAAYCQFVTRNPTGTGYQAGYNAQNDPTGQYLLDGTIQSVDNSRYVNLAGMEARGIDVAANYHVPIGAGLFTASLSGSYTLNQITYASADEPGIDYAGKYTYPRFKATLMTSYSIGKVTLGVNTRFISATEYDPTKSEEYYEFQHIPAYVYNDVTLNFRATRQFTLSFGVKNISNVSVPLELLANTISPHLANGSTSGAAGAAYYDEIGRYVFAKINLNF